MSYWLRLFVFAATLLHAAEAQCWFIDPEGSEGDMCTQRLGGSAANKFKVQFKCSDDWDGYAVDLEIKRNVPWWSDDEVKVAAITIKGGKIHTWEGELPSSLRSCEPERYYFYIYYSPGIFGYNWESCRFVPRALSKGESCPEKFIRPIQDDVLTMQHHWVSWQVEDSEGWDRTPLEFYLKNEDGALSASWYLGSYEATSGQAYMDLNGLGVNTYHSNMWSMEAYYRSTYWFASLFPVFVMKTGHFTFNEHNKDPCQLENYRLDCCGSDNDDGLVLRNDQCRVTANDLNIEVSAVSVDLNVDRSGSQQCTLSPVFSITAKLIYYYKNSDDILDDVEHEFTYEKRLGSDPDVEIEILDLNWALKPHIGSLADVVSGALMGKLTLGCTDTGLKVDVGLFLDASVDFGGPFEYDLAETDTLNLYTANIDWDGNVEHNTESDGDESSSYLVDWLLSDSGRTTTDGCSCEQKWKLDGFPKCKNYCCNPDEDEGGEWCFTDGDCNDATWGFCQPLPECTCRSDSVLFNSHSCTNTGHTAPWCYVDIFNNCDNSHVGTGGAWSEDPCKTANMEGDEEDKCMGETKKGTCRKISGCLWEQGECHMAASEPADVCMAETKAGKCKKISGCLWKNGECLMIAEEQTDVCVVETKPGKCRKISGCLWKNGECLMVANEQTDLCTAETKKGKCRKISGCLWEQGECRIAASEPVTVCMGETKAGKCRKISGCSWKNGQCFMDDDW